MPTPHPKNAPGDFYIELDCCITCGVMHAEAPSLFGWDTSNSHCYVAKQPGTACELDQMIDAFMCSDVNCLRYGGTHRRTIDRLLALGNDAPQRIDHLPGGAPHAQ